MNEKNLNKLKCMLTKNCFSSKQFKKLILKSIKQDFDFCNYLCEHTNEIELNNIINNILYTDIDINQSWVKNIFEFVLNSNYTFLKYKVVDLCNFLF